ncbi:hypothetical protein COW80_03435 [Candidatus Beckwithbacteria bacterium CG22_combo_CG10-13_8_21_14_all_01_47_9]|uniref:N-acetyltransferase domain-containing protein n=2 Tax=Candidatus Beckwithiibacteriota TaxID=1752726 RepID=A0A2H0E0B8_9BACT|nr:MAG: hypothetical protein COW80_03435 [Candidatus Beckwithbacteria bacterium CG22_combo_CG10-13_8_21_14_all_01_47_9]PJC66031.1 MAG: hypothetical protein CO018_04160 [Candidatus Beckwithbacteria bacterium CG_4_9_14_0_2_um_filter_47_11]
MAVKIRTTNKNDWKAIQKLNHEVYLASVEFDPYLKLNNPFISESVKYYKSVVTDPKFCCLVAGEAGKAIGYLTGTENNYSYRSNRVGEITDMGVSQEYRSKGVGSMLVDKFKQWCRQHELTHIKANAYYFNHKAIKFYEKQGMKPIDITLEGDV